jgi:hypothetical protein
MAIPLITGEETEKKSELLDKRYRQVIEALRKAAPEGAIIPEKIQAAREQQRELEKSGAVVSAGMLDPLEAIPDLLGAGPIGAVLGGMAIKKGAKKVSGELAERLARAKSLGFDTSKKQFHGTAESFSEFNPNLKGSGAGATSEGYGAYFSNKPEIASGYAPNIEQKAGGNVVPVYLKKGTYINQTEPVLKNDRALFEDIIKAAPDWEESIVNYGDENPKKALKIALDSLMQNDRKIEALHDIANVMYQGSLDKWGEELSKRGIMGFSDPEKGITVVPDPKNIRSIFANFDPEKASSRNISAGLSTLGSGALLQQIVNSKRESEK